MIRRLIFTLALILAATAASAGGLFGGGSGDASDATISGSRTFTGPVTVSSVTVQNQFLLGTGAGISTFTATAATLDDGLTLTTNGTTALNGTSNTFGNAITDGFTFTGQVILPSNAAPRTNVTPLAAFSFIVNTGSTPDQLCISTGTLLSQWALASNFSTACSN